MITNRQIHDIAEKAYAKRTGRERIGYSVRWECRNNIDGSIKVVKMMSSNNDYADHDVAGYMNKADAYRLARLIVKEGYTGVRTYRVVNCNKGRAYDVDDVIFSADWTPDAQGIQKQLDQISAMIQDERVNLDHVLKTHSQDAQPIREKINRLNARYLEVRKEFLAL